MTSETESISTSKNLSPSRQKFIQHIASLPIKPAARDYYVRWAESWTKARGHKSPERTHEYFDALTPARGSRRPPVVMTREEVRSVFARLEDPWKLIAQVMYGSGLRLMEAMRLRVKDLDFGQGTITIHDGKGGRHRVVTLPVALEQRLTEHLARLREKHLQDLAVGAGDVHMPEFCLLPRLDIGLLE